MNRSDIIDEVLLGELPNDVFMRGQNFSALPDDNTLGWDFSNVFKAVGTGLAKAGGAIAKFVPKALPSLIDVGSQYAQFRMQKNLIDSQAKINEAYNASMPTGSPTGSPAGSSYSPTTPSFNPYSQPTESTNIMTQQVAGIPVWALGAGAAVLLVLLLRKK